MRRWLLSALLPLSVLLVACGDEGSGGPTSRAGAQDPVGTWKVDWDASMPMILKALDASMGEATPEQRAAAKPMMEAMTAKMRSTNIDMRIDSGGTFTAAFPGDQPGATESAKGSWKKVPGGIEFTTVERSGKAVEKGSKDARPVTATFRGDDLVLTVDEATQLAFLLKRS